MSDEQAFNELRDAQAAQNRTDPKKHWEDKFVGKKFSEDASSASTFSTADLPRRHRILEPGAITTCDYYVDRVNIHVDDSGTCSHITMG